MQGVPDQNPLLNHVVLKRIFQLFEFDTKTFATFRLVCKQWNETSLTTWRKNAWLPVTTCRQHNGVFVEDYLRLLKSPEHRYSAVPFRKYIISHWCGVIHHYQYPGEKPERLLFWETVGPLMTHLNIKSTHFYSRYYLHKILFEFTPNIESLALSNNYYLTYKCARKGLVPVLLDPDLENRISIIKANTNLTEFKFHLGHGQIFPLTWVEIFELIEKYPKEPTWNLIFLLKTIEICRTGWGPDFFRKVVELRLLNMEDKQPIAFTLQFASRLTELRFPLKILTLDVGSETDVELGKAALQLVLVGHAETLEVLKLVREEDSFSLEDFPFGIDFPKLAKFTSTGKLVKNLDFLKKMPNLEFLHLEQDAEEIYIDEDFRSVSVVLENMKQFKITNRFCSRKQISTLGKIMPNLTNITVGFKTSSGFRIACKNWKKLVYMNVYTVDSDEDAFWNSRDAQKYIKDNIYDLTNLKSLKIGEFIEYGE
ncbi:unnamed protein product [Orchesella dallaii]|uniref:F-box domain-containing protein n=1 Tax=Orchesella dallaii TaxID=48710 RepID=A0ABP1S7K5_9HEXA